VKNERRFLDFWKLENCVALQVRQQQVDLGANAALAVQIQGMHGNCAGRDLQTSRNIQLRKATA
jgi:hypothetical protein